MTYRFQSLRSSTIFSALIAALILASAFTFPAQAKNGATYSDLYSFVESVRNGDGSALRGVYVQDRMAFQIVQQPAGSPAFVSQDPDQFTQFGMAAEAGNIGLLAHNYLAGRSLSSLVQGDIVVLVYGDGHTESFLVKEIRQVQALDPSSPYSDFKDLGTQATLSADELFRQAYKGARHVTFQTCIEANGDLSWGRLFVIAEPITEEVTSPTPENFINTFFGFWRR